MVPTPKTAQGQPLLPQTRVCWLAPSHTISSVPRYKSQSLFPCLKTTVKWSLWQDLSGPAELLIKRNWVGSQCLFRSKLTTCFSMTDRGVHILLYSQLLLKLKFKRSWDPGDTFSQHFTKAAAVYTGEAQMLRSTVTAPLCTHSSCTGPSSRAEKLPSSDAN